MSRNIDIAVVDWERPHLGMSSDPLCAGLLNAVWGKSPRDIFGNPPVNSITNRLRHGERGAQGNGYGSQSPYLFPAYGGSPTPRHGTIFGVLYITSPSERGICVGITDTSFNDTGLTMGVGNTAPDATGNRLVGVRGGINYTASGINIGIGVHTVGLAQDQSNTQWWVDGVPVSTGGTGSTWNLTGGTPAMAYAGHSNSFPLSLSIGIEIMFGAIWNRKLSDADMMYMHENPFRVVRS